MGNDANIPNDETHEAWLKSDGPPPHRTRYRSIQLADSIAPAELAAALALRTPSAQTTAATAYFSDRFTRLLRDRAALNHVSPQLRDRIKASICIATEGFDLLIVDYDPKKQEYTHQSGHKPSLDKAVETMNAALFKQNSHYVGYRAGMAQVRRIVEDFEATKFKPAGR